MKVLIVGATGNTGRLVTPRLLAAGHDVTAFARQPAKLTAAADRLRLVQGDVRDPPSLELAVMGQDAVIATFGPRTLGKTDVQEVFMRNLVAAMEHCDLIVVGCHAHAGITGSLPGSESMKLVAESKIPVLVCRSSSQRQFLPSPMI